MHATADTPCRTIAGVNSRIATEVPFCWTTCSDLDVRYNCSLFGYRVACRPRTRAESLADEACHETVLSRIEPRMGTLDYQAGFPAPAERT